jgi:hypothetical protein
MSAQSISQSRPFLIARAIAGPLFIALVLIQDYTRPGFDPRSMMLSVLALGDGGWVQIANFILAGTLNLLYAVGLWKRLRPGPGGTWGPILIGAYGLGLVTVGILTTDPVDGYPPGATAPVSPSWHGAIHAFGALVVFLLLIAALGVFTRYFFHEGARWWALYCFLSAVVIFALFFGGFTSPAYMVRLVRLATAIGWLGSSIVAIKLIVSTPAVPKLKPR